MPEFKKIHRKEVSVTGIALTRVLSDVLTSSDQLKYKIISIEATETSATEQNNAVIEAWLESERIIERNIRHNLSVFDAATREWRTVIPIYLDVVPGNTFKIGHVSGATLSTITYNIEYVIESEQR